MASSEEEIYSTMFSSLKHPVRRKILRMLSDKPMTFMEMVDHLGISSSHLTYHLESLGELISKMDDSRYRLSTFGTATVTAMKGVEESPVVEAKRGLKLSFKWKTVFAVLLIAIVALASFAAIGVYAFSQLDTLRAENEQLRSWGVDTNKVAEFLQNVAQIDTSKYLVKLLDNTLEYKSDFRVSEEIMRYSFRGSQSDLSAEFRFRDNHFSRYALTLGEDSIVYNKLQSGDILQVAKNTLTNYKTYSGDSYLDEMLDLIEQINQVENTTITAGNLKLKITFSDGTADFQWMHSIQGIDFSAKSVRMTFTNRVLTLMVDGYFLFTVGSTNLSVTQENAIQIANNYAKTLTWNIDGQQVTGFTAVDPPVSVELLPHPRPNSVALVPYWYVTLRLDRTYSGGINQIAIGVFADTGEVVNVQMLSR
ncbi:MAG: winged helix-turn-helix domain-containing protein [Betaproteobacteria bacterium]|jgi:DNA-binding transcriptional ArsR family regulator